jgi:sulfonate transport system substrate-binding protein
MNAGSVDFGIVGETPPIFGQAAIGSQIRYVAFEPPSPAGEAILVHQKSAIHSLADLKGKRIGVGKGSNAHYFLIRALASAGLSLNDAQVVYLKPADANAAFLNGDIDAWAIWDYYLAVAQQNPDARTLVDGQKLVDNHLFLLSTAPFLAKHAKTVQLAIEELAKTDSWIQAHPADAAQLLATQVGIDEAPLEIALKRAAYGPKPLTPEVIAAQQRIADTLVKLEVLPAAITVKDAVWNAP